MEPTDHLAQAGVEGIESGMIVGLGTGRAASRAIEALARRVRQSSLRVQCVATSDRSAALARSLDLPVLEMEGVARVDWLFDGADEVDRRLRMLKGGGGAMTREKIVAHAASHRVYLVQQAKLVPRLGVEHALPIEVLAFGQAWIEDELSRLGVHAEPREDDGGDLYRTDSGNPVLDAPIPDDVDPGELGAFLDAMPGVVGHGLFLNEADVICIEDETGAVREMTRQPAT